MFSRLLHNNWLSHGLVLAVGVALGWLALPLWRGLVMNWNQKAYGQLVEQCGGAMRDHYQAKMRAVEAPSQEAGLEVYSGEIGLIVCQDYDLYQKRLMQWGLSENELAQMRLKAIEARAGDLDEVVATHEIRF